MTPKEREELKREFDQLSELLKFHVDYDGRLSMSPEEHATYRDKMIVLFLLRNSQIKITNWQRVLFRG